MIFDCPVDRSWCAQRCCDGVAAATESLLRRSCADQLRRAHSARRVSTRCAEWGASIIPPRVDSNFNGRGPQSHHPGPV